MGHLAMLVAPQARQVLFLGVGTGITAAAALDYPIDKVTAVELVPEILDMLTWFEADNRHLARDGRVTLYAADARRFVDASGERFDLIVADLYHPSRDGTASLYTLEHFEAVREHLTDDGVFVQWLPLYQLRPDDLKTIARTFLRAFPAADSMPGEHDASLDQGKAYRESFGDTHYAFDHKGVHFIVVDNVSDPRALIGDDQLQWLAADLVKQSPDADIVVLTHRPLFDLYPQWDWATRDGAKAIDLLMLTLAGKRTASTLLRAATAAE